MYENESFTHRLGRPHGLNFNFGLHLEEDLVLGRSFSGVSAASHPWSLEAGQDQAHLAAGT